MHQLALKQWSWNAGGMRNRRFRIKPLRKEFAVSHQQVATYEDVLSYKEVLEYVFDRLYGVSWPIFIRKDFWHTANTLDTCVDFIVEGSKYWDLSARRKTVQ